jgi:uncharacterized lipoprotein YajG
MKTIIPLLAVMFLAGCGNNSTTQSSATNSVSSEPPADTNNMSATNSINNINNTPPVEMTNAPAITNGVDTNLPAMTNQ